MTIRGTKILTFDMAHMLANHGGLCSNVHGHTYKAEITIQLPNGATLGYDQSISAESMIMDFTDLKNVAKDYFDQFDHAFVYNTTNKEESDIAKFLEMKGKKVHGLPHRTTAELMAQTALCSINSRLEDLGFDAFIYAVTLYETPTSFATATITEVQSNDGSN